MTAAPASVPDMARSHGAIPEKDARQYAEHLAGPQQAAESGCYRITCVRCIPCSSCCVGCGFFCVCGDLLCPACSTIPFGCFIPLCFSRADAGYVNIKGDTLVTKVDAEKGTLGCFTVQTGPVICYCERM